MNVDIKGGDKGHSKAVVLRPGKQVLNPGKTSLEMISMPIKIKSPMHLVGGHVETR